MSLKEIPVEPATSEMTGVPDYRRDRGSGHRRVGTICFSLLLAGLATRHSDTGWGIPRVLAVSALGPIPRRRRSPTASSSGTTRQRPSQIVGSRFTSLYALRVAPATRIPFTGMRITMPCFVMSISSSSGSTSLMRRPRRRSCRCGARVMIPLPPRFCTRYSSIGEHLPMPFFGDDEQRRLRA